jgi:CII-binding regulator of phage lambda lysogenization HflD
MSQVQCSLTVINELSRKHNVENVNHTFSSNVFDEGMKEVLKQVALMELVNNSKKTYFSDQSAELEKEAEELLETLEAQLTPELQQLLERYTLVMENLFGREVEGGFMDGFVSGYFFLKKYLEM